MEKRSPLWYNEKNEVRMAKKENSVKKNPLKIVLIIVACLLAAILLGIVGLVIYARAPLGDYYKNAEKAFLLPGIDSGFIPQGLAYDETRNVFFVSGYDGGKQPSSLYLMQDGKAKHIPLLTENGEKFTGHSGGISHHGDYLYLAGSSKGCLYVLRYQDVLNAKDGESVRIRGSVKTFLGENDPIRVSFTGSTSTHIYVGEYYAKTGYSTPKTHHFESENQSFGGLVLEYAFDENAEWGVAPTPTRALSVVNAVQGMCFNGNELFLSVSGGFAHSKILSYDMDKLPSLPDLTVFDATVPHYATTDSALKKSIKTPPMSEEIVIVNDKLYAASEFAANRFILGKFTGAKYCYALDLTKYE